MEEQLKSNELRSGNYVYNGSLELVEQLSSYQIYNLYLKEQGNKGVSEYYNNLKPIELTEDWLLKMGFTDRHNYPNHLSLEILHNGIINAYDINDKVRIEVSTLTGYRVGETKVRHVHSLQNLIFTLTNKELEIKEL